MELELKTKIWTSCYSNYYQKNSSFFSSEFLSGMARLGLDSSFVPVISDLNKNLASTGWVVQIFDEVVSHKKFFQCLAKKVLPLNSSFRSEDAIEDFAYPDFFHDVFGHLPMLYNEYYSNFLVAMGTVGSEIKQSAEHEQYCEKVLDSNFSSAQLMEETTSFNKNPFEYLNRISWWTTDMGCIKEGETLKFFGAELVTAPNITIEMDL
ncbi:MAG: hypothetical protein AB8E15_00820 [Bdellovibrionales bacterium]